MKKTAKSVGTTKRATATFECAGLKVTIDLAVTDTAARLTAIEATRRCARALNQWNERLTIADGKAATASQMAGYLAESSAELLPAIKYRVAVVRVLKK